MWVRKVQIFLLITMIAAALRVVVIFYERHESQNEPSQSAPEAAAVNPDDLVFIRTSNIIDLAGTRKLVGQTLWVRNGYIYASWRAEAAHFIRSAETLPPLAPLQVRAFQVSRAAGGRRVFLLFDAPGGTRAVQIGSADTDGNVDLQLDSMFFFDDPHQIYSHWPADTWALIDRHEVRPGMNQLQAQYSLGVGKVESGEGGDATWLFPRDNRPLEVAFAGGKVTRVQSVGVAPAARAHAPQ